MSQDQADQKPPLLTAYHINTTMDVPIIPAVTRREWMNETYNFAYNCLPLNIANQHGWLLISPVSFVAEWNGGERPEDTMIEFIDDSEDDNYKGHRMVSSHFGFGIITFMPPYLFRTPPGYNLHVRGPANYVKPGIQALEGVVETDWLAATFTMNWRLSIPDYAVYFHRGDPFCMVTPVKRGEVESFETRVVDIRKEPEVHDAYMTWSRKRDETLRKHAEALASGTTDHKDFPPPERDYIRGYSADGQERFREHQTRLHVKPFRKGWLRRFWGESVADDNSDDDVNRDL